MHAQIEESSGRYGGKFAHGNGDVGAANDVLIEIENNAKRTKVITAKNNVVATVSFEEAGAVSRKNHVASNFWKADV